MRFGLPTVVAPNDITITAQTWLSLYDIFLVYLTFSVISSKYNISLRWLKANGDTCSLIDISNTDLLTTLIRTYSFLNWQRAFTAVARDCIKYFFTSHVYGLATPNRNRLLLLSKFLVPTSRVNSINTHPCAKHTTKKVKYIVLLWDSRFYKVHPNLNRLYYYCVFKYLYIEFICACLPLG